MAIDVDNFEGVETDEDAERRRAGAPVAPRPNVGPVDQPEFAPPAFRDTMTIAPNIPNVAPPVTSDTLAVAPAHPSLVEALRGTMTKEPRREDYMPPEPHGWAKLGHTLAAFQPAANAYFNVAPQRRGEQAYRAAEDKYQKDFANQLAVAREQREERGEEARETQPEREAKAREQEWQQHHEQENKEYDRRFAEQQDKWEKQQKETEARTEKREQRGEVRQEAREGRAEERQNKKTGEANKQKLQKTIDAARDVDQLDNEQMAILSEAQNNGERGFFGGGPYLNGPQSMQFLANHMALTVGRIKGARTGKDLIEAHIHARSLDQATEALAQRVLAGGVLTYDQAQQMLGTTGIKRKSAWDRVWDESGDYGVDASDQIPAEFGGKGTPRAETEKNNNEAPAGASHEVYKDGKLIGHVVNNKYVPLPKVQ